jgi:aldehyde:ferredoxin oxidoreductase
MNGSTGNILRVDLTRGIHSIEKVDPSIAGSFIGGRGLGVKIYTDEVMPDVDPLSPENKIVFSAGPLVGTGAICGSFCSIISKSPLTGILNLGLVRGHFGGEMKFAGFDSIVIEGRSDFPVYLAIIDSKISLRPAIHLWGRTNSTTDALIKGELGDRWGAYEIYTASIGPAGENLSDLSVIVTEGGMETIGGGGLGAVMGSKNLKAIALKGRNSIIVADGNRLMQVVTALKNRINSSKITSEWIPIFGTAYLINLCHKRGILPVKNFQEISFKEEDEKFIDEALSRLSTLPRRGCFSCPIACIKRSESKGLAIAQGFEDIGLLGLNLCIRDLNSIDQMSHLCREMGIGLIPLGGFLSTVMELQERGKLKPKGIDLDIEFGGIEGAIKLTKLSAKGKEAEKIPFRNGLDMARYFDEPDAFMGVKGASMPPIDPRGFQAIGLHLSTSNFGSEHFWVFSIVEEIIKENGDFDSGDISGKAEMVKEYQDIGASLDSLGLCPYILLGLKPRNLIPMIASVIGMDLKIEDLINIGERIWNLERSFNAGGGLRRLDDNLPSRFLHEPLKEGPAKGHVCRLSEMLPEYYKLRGWNEMGIPSLDTLRSLGLKD